MTTNLEFAQIKMNEIANTSTAYLQGFKAGLMDERSSRYGYSNPYDRRKKTGKDWSTGFDEGMKYRCSQGYQVADILRGLITV